MVPPRVTAEQLQQLLPAITEIGEPLNGGQKLVFPCTVNGTRCAVKVMGGPMPPGDEEGPDVLEEVFARATREVRILEACDSPHLPKLGPVPLTRAELDDQRLLVFSEEFIENDSLRDILRPGVRLTPAEICRLGINIARAIEEIWRQKQIHRDINPRNILRRNSDGTFVLIDPGIAFEVGGEELTQTGDFWHSKGYVAPERLNPVTRKDADSRSDLFLLGIVMYEAAVGSHPFAGHDMAENIIHLQQPRIATRVNGFPECLDEIIERLLSKQKHSRFRRAAVLIEALEECAQRLA